MSNGCCRRIGQKVGRPFRDHVAAGCEAQRVDELVVTGSGRARQYRARAGCIGPLRNADPASPLLIDPQCLTEPRDLTRLVNGIAVAREIARHAPFDPWRGDESIADAYLKRRSQPRRR